MAVLGVLAVPSSSDRSLLCPRPIVKPASPRAATSPIDWSVVHAFTLYELHSSIRSREWARVLSWFAGVSAALALAPGLYHLTSHRWTAPEPSFWLFAWTSIAAVGLLSVSFSWTSYRIARMLQVQSLEELLLTSSPPADLVLGAATGLMVACGLLLASLMPAAILAAGATGADPLVLLRIVPTLALCALLGHALGLSARGEADWLRSYLVWLLVILAGTVGAALVGLFVGDWLIEPFHWLLRWNPMHAVITSTRPGDHDWAGSMLVFLGLTAAAQRDTFRVSRRDWSVEQLAEKLEAALKTRQVRDQVGQRFSGPQLVKLVQHPFLPVIWREHGKAYRAQSRRAIYECFGLFIVSAPQMIYLLGLKQGQNVTARRLVALCLCLATLHMVHHAVRQVYASVRGERWPEWLLTRLQADELVEWLVAATKPWWLIGWLTAAIALLFAALVPPVPHPAHLLWVALTLLTAPVAFTLWATLIAVHAPTSADAHWRVFTLLLAIPLGLGLAVPFGVHLDGISLVSPVYAVLKWTFTSVATPAMWAGTLLAVASIPLCVRLLARNLRRWSLGD